MAGAIEVGVGQATAAEAARPGWWRSLVALLGGAFLAILVLAPVQAVLPTPFGPFAPQAGDATGVAQLTGAGATVAGLATSVGVLAAVTAGIALVSRRWLPRAPALGWTAFAALALGAPAALADGGPDGGATGLLAGLLALRYAAFAADGVPRPGLRTWLGLGLRGRRLTAVAATSVPVLCLLGAGAYGAAHPVGGGTAHRTSPPPTVTALAEPARVVELPILPTTSRHPTLLAVRGGAATPGLRVLAAGETPAGASDTGRDAAAPVLPMRLDGLSPIAWLGAARCPAAPVRVAAVEARVRSWAGTRWVTVPVEPPIVLACVPAP